MTTPPSVSILCRLSWLALQTALEMEKKKPLIRAVEIFKTVSPTCIVEIVHALQQVFMPPKEYIIVQGQYGYCMYFIRRGFVQITVIQADEEVPLAQLGDGAHFGEGALVGDHQRHANVLTLTHCEMEKLDQVIAHAPHSLNLPHYKPKLLSLSGAGRTVIELWGWMSVCILLCDHSSFTCDCIASA